MLINKAFKIILFLCTYTLQANVSLPSYSMWRDFYFHALGQGNLPRALYNFILLEGAYNYDKDDQLHLQKVAKGLGVPAIDAQFIASFVPHLLQSPKAVPVPPQKISVRALQDMQPASLWATLATGKSIAGPQEMADSFTKDCNRFEFNNKKIPLHTKDDGMVRVATYNVHYWHKPIEGQNFDGIIQTIIAVNADVIVLQEFSIFNQDTIKQKFTSLGYPHQFFCEGTKMFENNEPFGNMILSKLPFVQQPQGKLYDTRDHRCFIRALIALPNKKTITVYGTHLDVYDETEKKREAQIAELIAASKNDNNCIIAADFNAVRERDYQDVIGGKKIWDMLNARSLQYNRLPTQTKALALLERGGFVDCFTQANLAGPKFTVWTGTAVDFLYLKSWNLPIKGCYVYYSAASDHIPVIMDVDIN